MVDGFVRVLGQGFGVQFLRGWAKGVTISGFVFRVERLGVRVRGLRFEFLVWLMGSGVGVKAGVHGLWWVQGLWFEVWVQG